MSNQNKNPIRSRTAWGVVIAVLAIIFALSAQPQSAAFTAQIFGDFNHLVRKAAHFSEFALLFIFLRFALRKTAPIRWLYLCGIVAFVACGAYAGLDEWHQSFVPGRTPCINDVLIDMSGAATAWITVGLIGWIRSRAWRRSRSANQFDKQPRPPLSRRGV